MYVEIAKGSVSNRAVIIDTALLNNYAMETNEEMYNSYYRFDEEILEHFSIRKTIKNYRGKYYLENPIIDIDKGSNSNEVLYQSVIRFLDRLSYDFKVYPENLQIWFSGRGFHIVLPNIFQFKPSNDLPIIVKNTLTKYFPEGDNIYDGSRLIRTNYTINNKTGLYKIRVSVEQLTELKVDGIIKLASKKPTIVNDSFEDTDIPNLSNLVVYESVSTKSDEPFIGNIATCIQKMYYEGAIEGSRHNKMLRMITAWRKANIPKEGIIAILQNWAKNMNPYEIKRLVDDVFNREYHPYKCSDELMSKYCDSKCIFYKNKNYSIDVYDSVESEKAFIKHINSNLEERSFDFNEIWYCNSYKFYPGEAIAVIGDTKLGKSAFVQNVMVNLKHLKFLYLTMENTLYLSFRRFIQIACNMTKEEVIQYYKSNNNGLSESISHIKMVALPPTLNELKILIAEHNPDVLVIDTIDGIDVPNVYDDTVKTAILGQELKKLATQYEIILIAIAHISKSAAIDISGKAKRMHIHSAKGASHIEQKFDKILAWEGTRDDEQRFLTSLGARDESAIYLTFKFDWKTMKIIQEGI